MSEHAATPAVAPAPSPVQSFLDQHHFVLRRLHSLSGILPVGVFVIMHLFTNFQLVRGGKEFQHEVDFIHSTPALLFVEIALWSSIAFHAGLGLVYTFSGKPNVSNYRYGGNWRYTLQRTTGFIALIFIFLHIATLRWHWNIFGWSTPFYAHGSDGTPLAAATTARALQSHVAVVLLYIVGVYSVVFHWCNGLWTAAITWGLTISKPAQQRWGYVCLGLGIALSIFSAGAIVGALQYDLSAAEKASLQSTETGSVASPAQPQAQPQAQH